MKILVTGSKGFIGRNLVCALRSRGCGEILECNTDTSPDFLERCCLECDFVFHLAGVNRPEHIDEYGEGNRDFTKKLVGLLEKGSRAPLVFASSVQAELDNPYGISKRECEQILKNYKACGAEVYIYRFPNVFGKWCRPNYNSAVATFCYNAARGISIEVHDKHRQMHLVYIDDLVEELIACLNGIPRQKGDLCYVDPVYTRNLEAVAEIITGFSLQMDRLKVPDQSDVFIKKLYSTYLSYLPQDKLQYQLKMHADSRGSFTEFLKLEEKGQISVNVSKPHSIKGNHWHNSKHEIFLAVSGTGVVRLRRLDGGEMIQINISGGQQEPVVIPPGYVHSIENTGNENLVIVIWANEVFCEDRPDTYYFGL